MTGEGSYDVVNECEVWQFATGLCFAVRCQGATVDASDFPYVVMIHMSSFTASVAWWPMELA